MIIAAILPCCFCVSIKLNFFIDNLLFLIQVANIKLKNEIKTTLSVNAFSNLGTVSIFRKKIDRDVFSVFQGKQNELKV